MLLIQNFEQQNSQSLFFKKNHNFTSEMSKEPPISVMSMKTISLSSDRQFLPCKWFQIDISKL